MLSTKLRKHLVENSYVKHSIFLISIFTSKTYEIINLTGTDNEDDMRLNIIKTILVWLMLLFFFKINIYCILLIIILSLLSKYVKDMELNKTTKNNILISSNYLIFIIYIFGVYEYIVKNPGKSNKSIANSIFKTIN